jgi:hypothetical protein
MRCPPPIEERTGRLGRPGRVTGRAGRAGRRPVTEGSPPGRRALRSAAAETGPAEAAREPPSVLKRASAWEPRPMAEATVAERAPATAADPMAARTSLRAVMSVILWWAAPHLGHRGERPESLLETTAEALVLRSSAIRYKGDRTAMTVTVP